MCVSLYERRIRGRVHVVEHVQFPPCNTLFNKFIFPDRQKQKSIKLLYVGK